MSKPLILCATDLGEDGQRAADLAAAFAAALDGRVVLIHATDAAAGAAEPDVPPSMAEGAEALSRRARERLDREAATLGEHRKRCEGRGVPCEAALVDGRPADAIEREAADRGAGLIVLGRRTGRDSGFVGPTIHHVVRHAPCPIAVAPPEGPAPTSFENGRWVVGVDFSRQATAALGAAQALVERCGGEMILAQVAAPGGGEDLPYEERTPQQVLREEGNRAAARDLEALAQKIGKAARAVQRIGLERPADELLALANEEKATGIVVGTHGRTGLGRFFVGSTAEKLLERARLPVVVVRETASHVAPWFPTPDGEPLALSPNHVLVAVDFSDPSRGALEAARELAARLEVAVDVVHVYEAPTDIRRGVVGMIAKGAKSGSANADAEMVAKLRSELEALVAEVFGPDAQAVSLHVEKGRPQERIVDVARARNADLIVVGTSGRSGVERMLLGSVAESLVRHSPVPVLTVH